MFFGKYGLLSECKCGACLTAPVLNKNSCWVSMLELHPPTPPSYRVQSELPPPPPPSPCWAYKWLAQISPSMGRSSMATAPTYSGQASGIVQSVRGSGWSESLSSPLSVAVYGPPGTLLARGKENGPALHGKANTSAWATLESLSVLLCDFDPLHCQHNAACFGLLVKFSFLSN